MKYAFITQHKKTWPVDVMCRALGVNRNAYYLHRNRQSRREPDPERELMLKTIREIADDSRNSYGSRRMQRALNALGFPAGRHKTRRLMREANVQARYRKKYKVTTNSNHKKPLFENVLQRDFSPEAINQAWVSDMTYVWTQEGWMYLTVFIDLFNREVVGWNMSARMKAKGVTDALRMALWRRQPPAGLVVHSDRGSQYASTAYRKLLKDHGLVGSMSRKGDCWDNAAAESFFASLKRECVQWANYQTRAEARQDVLDYITMFYNSRRLHSSLGYCAPNALRVAALKEMEKAA